MTSQIGSTKTVYKSLMQRMIRFKFNLCMDIEEKPWSRCSNTFYSLFMYYCLTQPGKFSCAVDSFLELAFTILKDSLREINCNVFFEIILDTCLQLESYDEQTDVALVREPV